MAAAIGRSLQILLELRAVVRMSALPDDGFGALSGGETTTVRNTSFGDEDVNVVFGVVDVRREWNDTADVPARGSGGEDDDREERVAVEIAASPDAVDHTPSVDVGRVHVTVDVGLERAVYADDAESIDECRIVRDVAGSQHDGVVVRLDVGEQAVLSVGGESERCG